MAHSVDLESLRPPQTLSFWVYEFYAGHGSGFAGIGCYMLQRLWNTTEHHGGEQRVQRIFFLELVYHFSPARSGHPHSWWRLLS